MDFSKFKVGDWLMVGAAMLMLVLGLALDWATFEGVGGNNPFDYFFTGGIAWLLVVAAGVVTVLLVSDTIRADAAPWPLILIGATGLATLLMLLRIILGAGEAGPFELGRGPGMWISLLAAAVALAGALMNHTSAGGSLKDLTDFGKLRNTFGGSDDGQSAPPPPPPPVGGGASMPPPPPPTP